MIYQSWTGDGQRSAKKLWVVGISFRINFVISASSKLHWIVVAAVHDQQWAKMTKEAIVSRDWREQVLVRWVISPGVWNTFGQIVKVAHVSRKYQHV